MKKIFGLTCLVMLTGCLRAGSYDILPVRNGFIEQFSTYPITFFDNATPKLVKTEMFSEMQPATSSINTVLKGTSLFSEKTYKKKYYEDVSVKANKNGLLNSASIPSQIQANVTHKLIGEVSVDGKRLGLIASELKGFVILLQENGAIYNKMGKISADRLTILNSDFLATPEDLRFEPVKSIKVEQSKPMKGFDIKYDGLKLDHLVFQVLDFSNFGSKSDEYETLHIKYQEDSNIKINGVSIRVLFADDQKMDYIIIKY